jgi:hypothetical protein
VSPANPQFLPRLNHYIGIRVESRSGAVELSSAVTVSDPFGLSVSEYLTVSSVSRCRVGPGDFHPELAWFRSIGGSLFGGAALLLKKEGSSTPLKSLLNRFRGRAEPRSLSTI